MDALPYRIDPNAHSPPVRLNCYPYWFISISFVEHHDLYHSQQLWVAPLRLPKLEVENKKLGYTLRTVEKALRIISLTLVGVFDMQTQLKPMANWIEKPFSLALILDGFIVKKELTLAKKTKNDGDKITIDDKEYRTSDLSQEAKAQLVNLQFINEQILQKNNELQISDSARILYKSALKTELIKK